VKAAEGKNEEEEDNFFGLARPGKGGNCREKKRGG